MGPIASAAVRSGIATVGVLVLTIAAWTAQGHPGDAHKLSAALRFATHPTALASAGIGWLAFSAWLWLESRRPAKTPPGRLRRIGWAVLMTLVVSAGIVALQEAVQAVLYGPSFIYYLGTPWPYLTSIFLSALFAVTVVRFALPLIPRFDRMSPRNP